MDKGHTLLFGGQLSKLSKKKTDNFALRERVKHLDDDAISKTYISPKRTLT